MTTQFNKFKVRYIFIYYLLISIGLGLLVFFVLSKLNLDYQNWFSPFSVPCNIIYIILFTLLCLATIYRLKRCGVRIDYIIGNANLESVPWFLLAIIFYGVENLTTGINRLEYYFANLISPELAESSVSQLTESSNYGSENLLTQLVHYPLLWFVLVIVAPVTEEFIFRGVFLHRWAVKWNVFWSIILSSLLFGAIHWDIFWFSRAVGSVVWALFYIQTGSLLIPIILHSFHNGIVFIDILFQHFVPGVSSNANITVRYLWYGIVNIVLALPVLIYFLKFPTKLTQLPYFSNNKR